MIGDGCHRLKDERLLLTCVLPMTSCQRTPEEWNLFAQINVYFSMDLQCLFFQVIDTSGKVLYLSKH